MNKKFLFIILLFGSAFINANERRATCDNPPRPFTNEEYSTCKRVEAFMMKASTLHDEARHNWQSHQRLGLAQWDVALRTIPLSITAAQHIEAVLWDAGLGALWEPSHAWEKALEHIMWHEVYPAVKDHGKSAIITIAGVAAGASIYMRKATVEYKDFDGRTTVFRIPHTSTVTHYPNGLSTSIKVNEESLASATWSTFVNDWIPSTTSILFTLTIGIAYIGGKVYYKIHEKLPFMYFETPDELTQYIETLDRNAQNRPSLV